MKKSEVRKNYKISVRKWEPLKLPYQITEAKLQEFTRANHEKFKKHIYMGWINRRLEGGGPRKTLFVAATADSRLEAKKIFKKSENFGEDVWIID